MTVALTLDLEPDFGRRVDTVHSAWQPARVRALLLLLAEFRAPLTVFVVARSLDAEPDVIELLLEHGAEFQLHSFSHDLAAPDSAEEIARGALAFERRFGRRPEGYRAPEGRISPAGWARLEAEGFRWDSSVFPSFWPRPRYLRYRPRPFRPTGRRILELPISTLTPARLIVSLSWMKLLGWPRYRLVAERAAWPEPLVFDMHLHDLWALPSYPQLGFPWNLVYARRGPEGIEVLRRFLELAQRRGARFDTLGRIATGLESQIA